MEEFDLTEDKLPYRYAHACIWNYVSDTYKSQVGWVIPTGFRSHILQTGNCHLFYDYGLEYNKWLKVYNVGKLFTVSPTLTFLKVRYLNPNPTYKFQKLEAYPSAGNSIYDIYGIWFCIYVFGEGDTCHHYQYFESYFYQNEIPYQPMVLWKPAPIQCPNKIPQNVISKGCFTAKYEYGRLTTVDGYNNYDKTATGCIKGFGNQNVKSHTDAWGHYLVSGLELGVNARPHYNYPMVMVETPNLVLFSHLYHGNRNWVFLGTDHPRKYFTYEQLREITRYVGCLVEESVKLISTFPTTGIITSLPYLFFYFDLTADYYYMYLLTQPNQNEENNEETNTENTEQRLTLKPISNVYIGILANGVLKNFEVGGILQNCVIPTKVPVKSYYYEYYLYFIYKLRYDNKLCGDVDNANTIFVNWVNDRIGFVNEGQKMYEPNSNYRQYSYEYCLYPYINIYNKEVSSFVPYPSFWVGGITPNSTIDIPISLTSVFTIEQNDYNDIELEWVEPYYHIHTDQDINEIDTLSNLDYEDENSELRPIDYIVSIFDISITINVGKLPILKGIPQETINFHYVEFGYTPDQWNEIKTKLNVSMQKMENALLELPTYLNQIVGRVGDTIHPTIANMFPKLCFNITPYEYLQINQNTLSALINEYLNTEMDYFRIFGVPFIDDMVNWWQRYKDTFKEYLFGENNTNTLVPLAPLFLFELLSWAYITPNFTLSYIIDFLDNNLETIKQEITPNPNQSNTDILPFQLDNPQLQFFLIDNLTDKFITKSDLISISNSNKF